MRVLVLSSGGKDSSYAIWWALLRGWEVAGIVTIRITGSDSMMFQVPSTALAGLQSASAGIPWLPVPIDGEEANEMLDLEHALESVIFGTMKERSNIWSKSEIDDAMWPEGWIWPTQIKRLRPSGKIDGLVVGALASDYQKTKVELMCSKLGIKSFTPMWHHGGIEHMHNLVEQGFHVVLTSVSADGLGEEWVGRTLDQNHLDELNTLAQKHRFNVDGEGGEYETAVLNAPWMNRSIHTFQTKHWTGRRGWIDIWQAELV